MRLRERGLDGASLFGSGYGYCTVVGMRRRVESLGVDGGLWVFMEWMANEAGWMAAREGAGCGGMCDRSSSLGRVDARWKKIPIQVRSCRRSLEPVFLVVTVESSLGWGKTSN